MASQVLTKGLLLFNLSHPARNIWKEIFVEILICFKCYQLEDHPTSSCPKSKDYKICSLCASLEHTHREYTSINRKCINCEEGTDHSTLAMSCPFRKQLSKKKLQEIIQSTNSHQYSSATRPAIPMHILLIYIRKCLHIAIVRATLLL